MPEVFKGKWRLLVTKKIAGFSQRFRIQEATTGNGTYAGVVGTEVIVDGDRWTVTIEWNNNKGSGWQESLVISAKGSISPLVIVNFLRSEDNFPEKRDHDFDDLEITCIDLDPLFDVVQRPFALDRGTLTMLPDGIFDVSQGVQYMGVRIRNDWEYDWEESFGVMIGISNASRSALQSQGIQVLDAWTAQEQIALQQEVSNGFVKVPSLRIGQERTIYFKVNMSAASPCKPILNFVAQRRAWDPIYEELNRQVASQIFISRSTYDPANRELIAELPEGTMYLRLNRIIVDKASVERSMADALRNPCRKEPPRPGRRNLGGGGGFDRNAMRDDLKGFLEDLLSGKRVDPCRLRDLLDACCDCSDRGGDSHGGGSQGDRGDAPGGGGLADGPGADNWCRFKPFNWLPVEYEYRIVPNPPYTGQFGPLAFGDPWWKAALLLLAALLAAASIIYDYIFAGGDPDFLIGNITAKSNRAAGSNVDAAVALLNDSRGRDLNVLEAQGDDRNNGLPVNGSTGGTISIDRSDNGDRGIMDPVAGNVVFKSGARSGTTRGIILSINYNPPPVNGITYTNQVLVIPLPAPNNQPLSQSGDSGSLWVDLTSKRPVALNFAGPTSDDGSQGLANPIRSVVELFDIHFNV